MFAEQVKEKLEPLLYAVLQRLADGGDPLAFAFFVERQQELKNADSEAQVLEMFLTLSQVAFLGFRFSESEWHLVDILLAEAESVSAAMTAQGMH